MQKALLPENETARLRALYRYNILDSEKEVAFDELSQLAAEICETPIALISLVDPHRQWFKSTYGIEAEQTSRDIAFCAHAIHQNDIFEIQDTHQDIRFHDNPLVLSEPFIRFYAGVPLITPDGYAIGTICAIDTQAKQLSKHQRNAMKILAREVISQLERRLHVTQLKKANDRKSEFLSSLSHELNTPLHAIVSLSQLMLNTKNSRLPLLYQSYLEHLDVSGRRLLGLVNSVLDMDKIENGKLYLEEKLVDVSAFFDGIKVLIENDAREKSIGVDFSLDISSTPLFTIDESRLRQVILCIASNAIKFSPPNQTVAIHVKIKNATLTIAVKDQGIGMDTNDIPLMFTKFQKAANQNATEGTGIGLVMAKSLVELMDGCIHMLSHPDSGTLVKIKLPVKTSPYSSVFSSPVFDLSKLQSTKVLVVEDNQINQEVAKAIFAKAGISIDIAQSGKDAVKLARQNHYSVIFMDIHLPDFDGFEASRKIIENKPHQHIVALTADVFAINDERNQDVGIKEVINKPFALEDIYRILEDCTKVA